jgi:uncharacterized membrane protein YeaQ/YmgE (transglycosylase-associated protein family)
VAALVIWVLTWIVLGGFVGYAIGKPKGRSGEGFAFGAVLGVIGWVIVAVLEPTEEVRQRRQAESIALAATATRIASSAAQPQPEDEDADGSETADRYDTVERLGDLRDRGVLTSADFDALKRIALGGWAVSGLRELNRIDDLRKRELIDDREFADLVREIVDDTVNSQLCEVVLTAYGRSSRKVDNLVIDLQRAAQLPVPRRRNLPLVIANELPRSLAERWVELIDHEGGSAEIRVIPPS